MADISRYKMSQERLDDLKKELEYCETVREKEQLISPMLQRQPMMLQMQ